MMVKHQLARLQILDTLVLMRYGFVCEQAAHRVSGYSIMYKQSSSIVHGNYDKLSLKTFENGVNE